MLPPPSPAPLAPGGAYTPVVVVSMVVAGTVDTFDETLYTVNIAGLFNVSFDRVQLQVAAASVRITAQVTMSTVDGAAAAKASVTAMPRSQLSVALGQEIEEVTVSVATVAVYETPSAPTSPALPFPPLMPSPPMLPPSSTAPFADGGAGENLESDGLVAGLQPSIFGAILVVSAAGVICTGLLCFLRAKARRRLEVAKDGVELEPARAPRAQVPGHATEDADQLSNYKEEMAVQPDTQGVRHMSLAGSFGRLTSSKSAHAALKLTREASPKPRISHLKKVGRKSTRVNVTSLDKMDSVSATSAAVPPPPTDDISAAHSGNMDYL